MGEGATVMHAFSRIRIRPFVAKGKRKGETSWHQKVANTAQAPSNSPNLLYKAQQRFPHTAQTILMQRRVSHNKQRNDASEEGTAENPSHTHTDRDRQRDAVDSTKART